MAIIAIYIYIIEEVDAEAPEAAGYLEDVDFAIATTIVTSIIITTTIIVTTLITSTN